MTERNGWRMLQRPLLRAPRVSKLARLEAQAPRFGSGQVILPREAPWLGAYLQELLAFPYGRSNDQVDATSLALEYMTGLGAQRQQIRRRNPMRR